MPPESAAPGGAPTGAVSRRKLIVAGIVASLVLAIVVVTGIHTRVTGHANLQEWTEAQAIPTVAVALPATSGNAVTLDLPGRLEAYSRAPLYARVSGYLKSWHVDIGGPVKAGQLIAEIEAPDVDQQLLQARADLASTEANAALSEATAKRRQALLSSNWVSHQDYDEKMADLSAKKAAVKASQANVSRLEAMAGFKRIVAPFDGTVTARYTDVGVLINAGGGTALFVVSDSRKLRVTVNVPQNYVPGIKPGAAAAISVPEYPGRSFAAIVEASAQAVDATSGATQMQLVVNNVNDELMPGGFAVVRLERPRDALTLSVPATALIFDGAGLRVAVADAEDRVVIKPITIARDLGKVVEIASGIAATDRIIDSPPDGIVAGEKVRVAR